MLENLPDEADKASAAEALHAEEALARLRERARPRPPSDWDKETCYDCGVDLPPLRIKNQLHQCVPCKFELEAKQKGYRHEAYR